MDIPQTQDDYNNKTGFATMVKLSSLYFSNDNYVKELDITKFVKEVRLEINSHCVQRNTFFGHSQKI